MYLVDTYVTSETREGPKANPGVRAFFLEAARADAPVFISVISLGELRRGVELLRHRGDAAQAALRVPQGESPLDKQIAATALVYDLTVVTRSTMHFVSTGVRTLDPFR